MEFGRRNQNVRDLQSGVIVMYRHVRNIHLSRVDHLYIYRLTHSLSLSLSVSNSTRLYPHQNTTHQSIKHAMSQPITTGRRPSVSASDPPTLYVSLPQLEHHCRVSLKW